MPPERCTLELAEALERAYRLALAVDTLAADPSTGGTGTAMGAVTSELLSVIDLARASLLWSPRGPLSPAWPAPPGAAGGPSP